MYGSYTRKYLDKQWKCYLINAIRKHLSSSLVHCRLVLYRLWQFINYGYCWNKKSNLTKNTEILLLQKKHNFSQNIVRGHLQIHLSLLPCALYSVLANDTMHIPVNLSGMYVLREIWQNSVANGSGMLFSVLKEIWRNPTKKLVIKYHWI